MLHRRIPYHDRSHELVMKVECEERHRERAEVCLENGRDAANVIEAVRIPKVEGGVIATFEKLSYGFGLA